jgi:hypothetical protein
MVGCDLSEPDGGEDRRLVQTYARDTGTILPVLSVPLYIRASAGARRSSAGTPTP